MSMPPPTPDIRISTTIREGGLPEPTLPNPTTGPLGGGMPLWVGLVLIAMVAAPLVFLIVSGR